MGSVFVDYVCRECKTPQTWVFGWDDIATVMRETCCYSCGSRRMRISMKGRKS